MVSNDLSSLVNTRPLKFWKETLALLCSVSFVTPDEEKFISVTLQGIVYKLDSVTFQSIIIFRIQINGNFVAEFVAPFCTCSIIF